MKSVVPQRTKSMQLAGDVIKPGGKKEERRTMRAFNNGNTLIFGCCIFDQLLAALPLATRTKPSGEYTKCNSALLLPLSQTLLLLFSLWWQPPHKCMHFLFRKKIHLTVLFSAQRSTVVKCDALRGATVALNKNNILQNKQTYNWLNGFQLKSDATKKRKSKKKIC